MAEYKTLGGLNLDIGGYTESVTRSKQTLEEVSRKNRGIGAKPETEEVELDSNFLEGIAQLFRDNGYEPKQPSEDSTTTPKDEVLDEYSKLMKSEIIQDAMREPVTLGESPNKLEDIYTTIDTYTATFDDQPTVDSESETLEITQTQPQGLMSRPSDDTQVDRTELPSMAEEAAPTEEVSVDSDIISSAFLNSIGVTGSLTEEGVQKEVKKVLKEQGLTDEEITAIVNKSLNAVEVQQRTDIPEGGLGSPVRDTAPLGDKFTERYTETPNVDFDFIKELEGFEVSMYVPKNKKGKVLGKSGATIASGFDLGQRKESDLKGLPQSLINKLKPYLGKKKKAAADFVKNNPLTITKAEANIINAFAKQQEMKRLIKQWNAVSDVKWDELSKPKATAVASVHFQYGNLPIKTDNFWNYATSGDWISARKELNNFGDDYPTRRKKEAKYLEKDLLVETSAY